MRVRAPRRSSSSSRGVEKNAECFGFSTVWQLLTPQQRTEAVQAMIDLLSLARSGG